MGWDGGYRYDDTNREGRDEAVWSRLESCERRCRELQERLRLGQPAHDVMIETTSLGEARARAEAGLKDVRERIEKALVDAQAATTEANTAEERKQRSLWAAQAAETLDQELRHRMATLIHDAFVRGRKSGRIVQIGGGFLTAMVLDFLGSWLFGLYGDVVLR